jgi:intracellular septation protein A
MTRLLSVLRFILEQFGTMAVFYALLYTLGLKAAIAGSIVFVAVDAVRRHRFGIGFPRLYILTSVLTFLFGGIDLMSQTPFMIKYEAVITSLIVAASFAWTLFGDRPMLQELAEQQTRESFPDRADVRAFFRILTLLWIGYFVLRAIVYFWIGATLPIERAMEIRPFIGTPSLLVMMAISFQGRRLFLLLYRLGLLPAVEETAPQPAQSEGGAAGPYSRASSVSTSWAK